MSDDAGYNVGSSAPSGLPWYMDPSQGAMASTQQAAGGQITPYMAAIQKAVASGALDPAKPVGPAGAMSPIGTPLNWVPYDPNQQLNDAHFHFGDTYDDPNLGKLQSVWTEPSKSDQQMDKLAPMIAGAALSAITAGAASPLMGSILSAAMKYGQTGSFDPKSMALSVAMGALPGALGGIDPSLAQAYRLGSGALGVGNAAYQASRGNYNPAVNAGAGYALKQLTGGG